LKQRSVFTKDAVRTIQRMHGHGSPNKAIALAIGTTEASLRARSSQLKLPTKRVRMQFAESIVAACEGAAQRRNITPCELIQIIMERVVQDDLFEAILDDGF
jgi:hypothetical protein